MKNLLYIFIFCSSLVYGKIDSNLVFFDELSVSVNTPIYFNNKTLNKPGLNMGLYGMLANTKKIQLNFGFEFSMLNLYAKEYVSILTIFKDSDFKSIIFSPQFLLKYFPFNNRAFTEIAFMYDGILKYSAYGYINGYKTYSYPNKLNTNKHKSNVDYYPLINFAAQLAFGYLFVYEKFYLYVKSSYKYGSFQFVNKHSSVINFTLSFRLR